MNRDLKSFLKGGAMIAGLGIGAAHFLSDDPHVMPEKILTVMVSASVIGAADGMASLGWENYELEARVEKVRDEFPDSLHSKGFDYLTTPMKITAFSVKQTAYEDARKGLWSEDALEGYLRVAEAQAQDLDLTEGYTSLRSLIYTPEGDLQNVSYSDIMPEIRPDNCGGFANMTFGRGASGEYARLALSQTISYQHEFFSFMREVRWKDHDTPEEYEAARAARRAEIDDLVIDGWVTRSGFYNSPDESLRAVSEKTADIETPSPI